MVMYALENCETFVIFIVPLNSSVSSYVAAKKSILFVDVK